LGPSHSIGTETTAFTGSGEARDVRGCRGGEQLEKEVLKSQSICGAGQSGGGKKASKKETGTKTCFSEFWTKKKTFDR